jgi:peptidoglycan/LPS O-acetylase OafA/YrhL
MRSPSGARVAGMDGLRAIAASLVVVYHCWLYASPNGVRVSVGPITRYVLPYLPVGVTLFFSLSGFLLYRPIADAVIRGTRRQPLASYLRNRALRILPAYWTVLLVLSVLLGAGVVRVSATAVGLANLAAHPSVLALNLALLQSYIPGTLITGIPPAWTLCVEAVFYLTLPMLGWLAARTARRASGETGRLVAAFVPSGLMLVVGLSGKVAAWHLAPSAGGPAPGWQADWHSVLVRSFWAQADLFAFGMALAVVWAGVNAGRVRLPSGWRRVAMACLVPVALSTVRFGEGQVLGDSLWATLLAVGCAIVVALVALDDSERGSIAVRLLEIPVVAWIGVVSYSVYLWHEPLARWLSARGWTFAGRPGFVLNIAIVYAVSLALAALTYRFVERPALRMKRRSSQARFDDEADDGRRRSRQGVAG